MYTYSINSVYVCFFLLTESKDGKQSFPLCCVAIMLFNSISDLFFVHKVYSKFFKSTEINK